MSKTNKIISLVVLVVIVSIGGFFYWKNQQTLKDINKNLPEDIKITKNLFGSYKIINKTDNYSFETPKEWKNIQEVRYIPKRQSKGYNFSSVNVKGEASKGKVIAVVKFESKPNKNLLNQANLFFNAFRLNGKFSEEKIKEKNIVISKKVEGLRGIDASFFKKGDYIYLITCESEKFIKEVIINGKW